MREGYLVRRRGAGTFVSEPKIAQELTMTSFTEDMRQRGMQPASRTLELRTVPAGARLGRILHVSPSEPIVVATRLRLADRETMAIETLHVRQSLVPDLSAMISRSIRSTSCFRTGTGSKSSRACRPSSPPLPEKTSRRPGVPLHSPAFVFERVTRSQSDEIVEYVRSVPRRSVPARHRAPTRRARAVVADGARRAQRRLESHTTVRHTMVKILTPEWLCANLPAVASGLNQFRARTASATRHRIGARGRPCPTPMEVRP